MYVPRIPPFNFSWLSSSVDVINGLHIEGVSAQIGDPGAGRGFNFQIRYSHEKAEKLLGLQFRNKVATAKDIVEDFRQRGWLNWSLSCTCLSWYMTIIMIPVCNQCNAVVGCTYGTSEIRRTRQVTCKLGCTKIQANLRVGVGLQHTIRFQDGSSLYNPNTDEK